MPRWNVRLQAVIDDTIEVEADTEAEAEDNANADWSFVEAHSWEAKAELIEEDNHARP